ncbi:MAG: hypothetical protein WBW98_13915 [Candidatus Sulfotelmatobacter sp.]|jgi:putative SOS response-associated peptidase YedK
MTREAKIDVRDHPAAYDVWLDPGMQNVAAASELLKPFDARLMRCYPVSTRVNYVVNDDEECSAPVVKVAQIQRGLFS